MSDVATKTPETDLPEVSLRIYELGYHIISTVKEDETDRVSTAIRSVIEKAGGSFIAEGAPQNIKLAYPMFVTNEGKRTRYNHAYFGWIKFEVGADKAEGIEAALKANKDVLRSLMFKTVREDTRASARPTGLREVRREGTIKSTPKKGAEGATEEVSEEALDKSIEGIITA
jgi:ribosomal protein S6